MGNVLVVEDEGDVREILVEVISDAGFQIIEAATADAAFKDVDLTDIQLIVTDINLPGNLDGIDLAIAARQAHPGIPIVFISGRPGKLADAHVMSDPAAFLLKPFSLNKLVRDVERLVSAA